MNITNLAVEIGISKQCLFSYLWKHKYQTIKKGRDVMLTEEQMCIIRNYYNNKNTQKSLPLDTRQIEMATGSLLGDGCLSNPPRGDSRLIKTQCRRRREYLEWHVKEFGIFSKPLCDGTKSAIVCKNNKITVKNEGVLEHTQFYTKNSYIFTKLRKKWYKDNVKVVPTDVELSPLSISVWYCDDGYNDVKRNQIRISTNAFTFKEVEFLKQKLKLFGFCFNINKSESGKPILVLSRKQHYNDFIDLVSQNVTCDCMKYKTSK